MIDLATEIHKLCIEIKQLKATLQDRLHPPNSQHSVKPRTRSRPLSETRPPWDSETQPPWAADLFYQLSKIDLAMKLIVRKFENGSTMAAGHSHNPISLNSGQSCSIDEPLSSIQRLSELGTVSQTPASKVTISPDSSPSRSAEALRESLHTTSRTPSAPSETSISTKKLNFSLSKKDMGKALVPTLLRLVKDDQFAGILSVEDIEEVDWADLMRSIKPPAKNHDLLGVKYSNSDSVKGVVVQGLSKSKTFKFPDFSQPIAEPSRQFCLDYLRQLIDNPPRNSVPYYVGPPLMPIPVNELLHPGEALLKLLEIQGVNTIYWHAGEPGSGTAFHCEDFKLYSVNWVLWGWKLWIVIRLNHTEKFEAFIRKHWPANNCDQFVRHNSLLISVETLKKEGIEFDIHIAGPNQMVVTQPRQYHAVVNITKNMAMSINFADPNESVIPPGQCICPKCGLYPLDSSDIQRVPYDPTLPTETNPSQEDQGDGCISQSPEKQKRVSDEESTQCSKSRQTGRNASQKRVSDEESTQRSKSRKTGRNASQSQKQATPPCMTQICEDLKDLETKLRKMDELCHLPSVIEKPPAAVFKLVAAIGSRAAVQQFFALVTNVRVSNDTVRLEVTGDTSSRAFQRARLIRFWERNSLFAEYFKQVNRVFLARDLEELKAGRQRSDPTVLRKIERDNAWSKSTLEQHRRIGNKWNRICGKFEGLLCFIFLNPENPFDISPKDYESMTDEDLKVFHRLLEDDYFKSLHSAGEAFQRSLNSTAVDVEFCWEGRKVHLDRLSEKELLSCLAPSHIASENVYNESKFSNRPRPSAWPKAWPWPCDPTWIPPGELQCEFCPKTSCNCIKTKITPEFKPRIRDYGEKGRGLQAVAPTPQHYAYWQGQIIGELVGELEPVGKFRTNKWVVDVVREDLDGQDLQDKSVVCQISCRETGNFYRLVNHGCKPNVILVGMRISGRYRWVYKAARHIFHNEELTANFTKQSLGGPCLCVDCVQQRGDNT